MASTGTNDQLLKASLSRLRDEISTVMNQPSNKHYGACDALTSRYNELLAQAKSLFPNESQISSMKNIETSDIATINPLEFPRIERQLQETKIRTLELMDKVSQTK